MSALTVVDGSNVVNEIGRLFAGGNDLNVLRDVHGSYLRDWLDLDRFIYAALEPAADYKVRSSSGIGTVIFRSAKKIGRESSRWYISGTEHVNAFWARQGGSPDTSVSLVDIPEREESLIAIANHSTRGPRIGGPTE